MWCNTKNSLQTVSKYIKEYSEIFWVRKKFCENDKTAWIIIELSDMFVDHFLKSLAECDKPISTVYIFLLLTEYHRKLQKIEIVCNIPNYLTMSNK